MPRIPKVTAPQASENQAQERLHTGPVVQFDAEQFAAFKVEQAAAGGTPPIKRPRKAKATNGKHQPAITANVNPIRVDPMPDTVEAVGGPRTADQAPDTSETRPEAPQERQGAAAPAAGAVLEMGFTLFPDQSAQTMTSYAVDGGWDGICTAWARPAITQAVKDALPWFKLAHFDGTRTDKKCLRHDAAVTVVFGVEGDYDSGDMTFDQAVEALAKAGIEAMVLTSPRYTPEKPKLRILAPLATPLTRDALGTEGLKAARKHFVQQIAAVLPGTIDPVSFNLSQSFIFGNVQDHEYRAQRIRGQRIDTITGPAPAAASKPERERAQRQQDDERFDPLAAFRALLVTGENIHGNTMRIAASLARKGMPEQHILALLQSVMQGTPDVDAERWQARFDDLPRLVESGIAKYAKTPPKLDYIESTDDTGATKRTGFLVSAHDVEDENIDWVWKHRLARGALHLIAGHPGTAKSTIAFDWAATISSGGTFPDATRAPIGKVVIWTGEDNLATTVKPRMRAAGANFDNVIFIAGKRKDEKGEAIHFNPAEHMPQLREELEQHPDITLVLIDPIVAMIKGKSDSHKNAEVRKDLQPLVDMLEDRDIIGIGITHFTKGTSGKHIVERITGSLAFGAVARMAYCTVQEKDEPNKYRLVLGKTNIAPLGGGYEYQISLIEMQVGSRTIEATKIIWGAALEGDPLKLIADAEGPPTGRPPEKRCDAVKLLNDLLANGPVLVADIKKACEAHGISYDTMKRARKDAGVIAAQVNPADNRSPWQWASLSQTFAGVVKRMKRTKAKAAKAKAAPDAA